MDNNQSSGASQSNNPRPEGRVLRRSFRASPDRFRPRSVSRTGARPSPAQGDARQPAQRKFYRKDRPAFRAKTSDEETRPYTQRDTQRKNDSPKQADASARPSGKTSRPRSRAVARPRRSSTTPALEQRIALGGVDQLVVQPVTDPETVRFAVVAGAEEVGRNMYFYEDSNDIVIFDCGLQFVSPEQKAPGVQYILPNTQYLEAHKDKIRAIVVTHGHLDHIGGIQFIAQRLNNPPIYTQYLSSLLILKRQEEFPHLEPLTLNVVKEGESFKLGEHGLTIETFAVTHSIPDAMGIKVKTKYGNIIFTGDVRLDHKDEDVVGPEKTMWKKIAEEHTLALIADSTNADRPGFSMPESIVHDNLERLIRSATGRLVIGTFASQFERLMTIIRTCEELGKIVVPEGRSIKTNIDIALKAGLLKVKPGTIVSAPESERYPVDRIVVLATGAQGEEFAALSRMATGEHKYFKLGDRDTLILSSSVIPGNELAVQALKDKVFRNNTRVITYQGATIHSSGHGYAGELGWIRRTLNPQFLIPIHGNHYFLKSHMYSAIDDGFPRERVVVPDNGSVIEFYKGEIVRVLPDKLPSAQLTVDGLSVGVRQEIVLRDRMALGESGMFIVFATINVATGKLRKSPDIISRGFVYLRENQQLLAEARTLVRRHIEHATGTSRNYNIDALKDEITDLLTKFLLQRTNKTPMVIPVIVSF